MIRIFCDKCEQPCTAPAGASRRHEAMAYLPAGGALGLELVPLYDGQAGTGHLCDGCLQAALAQLAGTPVRAPLPPDLRLEQRVEELGAEIIALRKSVGALEVERAQLAKELNTSSEALERERAHAGRWKARAEALGEDLRKRDGEATHARSELTDRERANLLADAEAKMQRALSVQESRLANEWSAKLRTLQDELVALRRAQAA